MTRDGARAPLLFVLLAGLLGGTFGVVGTQAAGSPVPIEVAAIDTGPDTGPPQVTSDAADWYRRDLRITTRVDSDRDGRRDRVHATLVRPTESDRDGVKLATVVWSSPYFACCGEAPNHDVDVPLYVPKDPRAPAPDSVSQFARRWVPHGYAVLVVESLGSGGSTGCPTIGDAKETAGPKAAIDWLNGRARARDAVTGHAVSPYWASGRAGMVGISYDGTLANMVAATGVEGLDAIIPESAISNWYSYYRDDGLVVAPGGYQGEDTDVLAKFDYTRKNQRICDRVIAGLARRQDRLTGDYSNFWAARNLLPSADRVHAAVLVSHGLADFNVKTSQAADWYTALKRAGVEHMIFWGPGEHGVEPPMPLQRRWVAHYLYDVDNGVETGPRAWIEGRDGQIRKYAEWPDPAVQRTTYALRPRGKGTTGWLSRTAGPARTTERFRDVPDNTPHDLATHPDPRHGLVYVTPPLRKPTRLSGTPVAHLALSFSQPAGNLTAALLVVKPSGRTTLVTEGWTDPQNRFSIWRTDPVRTGKTYGLTVRLQANDRRFAAGDRIALVVMSTDHDFTIRPPAGNRLALDLFRSDLVLPLVAPTA